MATKSKLEQFSQRLDLVVEQGSTFNVEFVWKGSDEVAIDITGYKIRMQLRDIITDVMVTDGELTTENATTLPNIQITDAANGVFQVVIPSAITETYSFTTVKYDLEMVLGTPEVVTRLVYGKIKLSTETTK